MRLSESGNIWKTVLVWLAVSAFYWALLVLGFLPTIGRLYGALARRNVHPFLVHAGVALIVALLQGLDAFLLATRYPARFSPRQLQLGWAAATALPAGIPLVSSHYIHGSDQPLAYLFLVHLLLAALMEKQHRTRSPSLEPAAFEPSRRALPLLAPALLLFVTLSLFEHTAYAFAEGTIAPHRPRVQYYAYSTFLLSTFFWGLGLLSGRVLASFLPVVVGAAVLYSVAILKYSHLSLLPRFSDLFLVRDALAVSRSYLRVAAFAHWLLIPILAVIAVRVVGQRISRKACLAGLIVSIAGIAWTPGVSLSSFRWSDEDSLQHQGVLSHLTDTAVQYRAFLQACSKAGSIDGEAILSRYPAVELPAGAESGPDTLRPTVVLYVIESFLDPRELTIKEPRRVTPNFLRIAEEGRSFDLVVPVHGGMSVQTEFELLTGLSVDCLPQGLIACDWMNEDLSSVPTELKRVGYRSTAIVSDAPAMFRRNLAWKHLGWDETVFLDDSTRRDRTGLFIPDEVVSTQIVSRLAAAAEAPQFLFGFPGALHGPWDHGTTGGIDLVDLASGEIRNAELAEYLYRIRDSDEALGQIVRAIEASPQPAILIVTGDHRPALRSTYADLESRGLGDFRSDLARHRVVCCVWGNSSARPFLNRAELPPASVFMRSFIEQVANAEHGDPLRGLLKRSKEIFRRRIGIHNPFQAGAASGPFEGIEVLEDHLAISKYYFSGKASCLKAR